jgi:hypothetical protein
MSTYHYGFGWIIKAGYVQNARNFQMRYVKVIEDIDYIIDKIQSGTSTCIPQVNARVGDVFDWLILQPRVSNGTVPATLASTIRKIKMEPKKRRRKNLWNRSSIPKKKKSSVPSIVISAPLETKIVLLNGIPAYCTSIAKAGLLGLFPESELFDFAKKAARTLSENTNNAFYMEGISRVDLFSIEGKLFVNEFENVDSQYSKLGGTFEEDTYRFLVSFYSNRLEEIIKALNI